MFLGKLGSLSPSADISIFTADPFLNIKNYNIFHSKSFEGTFFNEFIT